MTIEMRCDYCGQDRSYEYGTGDRSGLCSRADCKRARALPDDAHILAARAVHRFGALAFDRVRQDRRWYYRLTVDGRSSGLTDRLHAEQTIEYWRSKGWIANG